MQANKDLLLATLDKIKTDPASWNQREYFCGTSCCFAGHVCLLAGWKRYAETQLVYKHDISPEHAADVAQKLLGITGWQAANLFHSNNSLEELECCVENIINGDCRDDD